MSMPSFTSTRCEGLPSVPCTNKAMHDMFLCRTCEAEFNLAHNIDTPDEEMGCDDDGCDYNGIAIRMGESFYCPNHAHAAPADVVDTTVRVRAEWLINDIWYSDVNGPDQLTATDVRVMEARAGVWVVRS